MSDIVDELTRIFGVRKKSKKKKPGPRPPSDGERAKWFDEAKEMPPSNLTIEEMRHIAWMKNPIRMRRLTHDFKWLQKQVQKVGKNPDDARWVL